MNVRIMNAVIKMLRALMDKRERICKNGQWRQRQP